MVMRAFVRSIYKLGASVAMPLHLRSALSGLRQSIRDMLDLIGVELGSFNST